MASGQWLTLTHYSVVLPSFVYLSVLSGQRFLCPFRKTLRESESKLKKPQTAPDEILKTSL